MKKSTYSIVLSDRVIAEIDRLAYQKGTNRSNMINQILAEYVSLTTPEMRIGNIFDEIAAYLYTGENFREMSPPTSSVMSMRSALSYKYNPTVKYTVELYRDPEPTQGVLRVSVRSTNPTLLMQMLDFYQLWAQVEAYYGFSGQSSYEGGVFKRHIIHRKSPLASHRSSVGENMGKMLATYISLFDRAMKDCLCDRENAKESILSMYYDYLSSNTEII